MTPIDLVVEEHFHRAAPGGMGGTKAAGNYSPVSAFNMLILDSSKHIVCLCLSGCCCVAMLLQQVYICLWLCSSTATGVALIDNSNLRVVLN